MGGPSAWGGWEEHNAPDGRTGRVLRPQYLLVLERSLQGRLHSHLAEFVDGDVQVLEDFGLLSRVVLQE